MTKFFPSSTLLNIHTSVAYGGIFVEIDLFITKKCTQAFTIMYHEVHCAPQKKLRKFMTKVRNTWLEWPKTSRLIMFVF